MTRNASTTSATSAATISAPEFSLGSWIGGFLFGAAIALTIINGIHPLFTGPQVQDGAKVCVAYEQTSGDCAKESTVGQIIEDARNAEAGK